MQQIVSINGNYSSNDDVILINHCNEIVNDKLHRYLSMHHWQYYTKKCNKELLSNYTALKNKKKSKFRIHLELEDENLDKFSLNNLNKTKKNKIRTRRKKERKLNS